MKTYLEIVYSFFIKLCLNYNKDIFIYLYMFRYNLECYKRIYIYIYKIKQFIIFNFFFILGGFTFH